MLYIFSDIVTSPAWCIFIVIISMIMTRRPRWHNSLVKVEAKCNMISIAITPSHLIAPGTELGKFEYIHTNTQIQIYTKTNTHSYKRDRNHTLLLRGQWWRSLWILLITSDVIVIVIVIVNYICILLILYVSTPIHYSVVKGSL